MWRSKKFIIIALLAAIVLVGSTAGVVFARSTNGGERTGALAVAQTADGNGASSTTLLARVAKILGIDQKQLEDAFAQAQKEMRDEALDNYLKDLVAQNKITQEQADQYKAWLQARPDMAQYEQQLKDWQQARPGIPPELKGWQEARPDIPLPGWFGGHGGMKGGGERFFGGR